MILKLIKSSVIHNRHLIFALEIFDCVILCKLKIKKTTTSTTTNSTKVYIEYILRKMMSEKNDEQDIF